MPRCLAAALFAAFVLAVGTPPASAASFDCGRAYTALEKAVCADPKLSALDEEMARNYLGLLRRVSGKTESALKAEQKSWLKQRNACGDDTRCIASQYRARITRIANVASDNGLVVDPKRTTRATAEPIAVQTGIFSPRTIARPEPAATQPARTTAERAAQPGSAQRVSIRPDGTVDEPEQKSPGLLTRMLSRIAPNLVEGDRNSEKTVGEGDAATPEELREEPQPRVARREERPRTTSILPSEPQYDEPAVRKVKVVKRRPAETPEPAAKDTIREQAAEATPAPAIADQAPAAPEALRQKLTKAAPPPDAPGAPAVLLYTTPDVSRVIRLPDGESPFDKLDAQRAFEEPEPAPARALKATPENLPQPSRRTFDARRFDAFDETPNG